jgi:hypothetical protein
MLKKGLVKFRFAEKSVTHQMLETIFEFLNSPAGSLILAELMAG